MHYKQEIEKVAKAKQYVCQGCGRKRNEKIEPHCKDCGHDHTVTQEVYDKEQASRAENVCEKCGYGWVNEDQPGCKKCGHDMSISRENYKKRMEKKAVHYKQEIEKVAKKKSQFQKYKDNKVELTPEEKKIVKEQKAVWNGGSPDGSLAVWKSVDKDGKTTYITHTHRAYNTAPTLKGAISRFHNFIKSTASESDDTGMDKSASDYKSEIEKIAADKSFLKGK